MALLDITGGAITNSNIVQGAVGSDAQGAPLPDSFVSSTVAQKLDADFYTATETGDNSEGLAGSGNLNHALLQAQQNDLLSTNTGGEAAYQHDVTLGVLAAGIASGYTGMQPIGTATFAAHEQTAISDTPTASGFHSIATAASQFLPASTPPNLESSDISSDTVQISTQSITPTSGSTGQAGPAGINGQDGSNGNDGSNGTNGIDGTGGGGGDGCCGPSIIDIDITGPIIQGPVIDLGDVSTVINHLVENVTTTLPDIITTPITTIEHILSPLLDPPPAGGDTDLVIDLGIADAPILGDTLTVGLDVVEQIVGDVDINLGVDGVLQGDSTTVSLDGTALGGALPDINISLPVTVETVLSDPLGSVSDVVTTLPDTVTGLVDSLTDGLLSQPGSGDTDLVVDLGIADAPILGDTLNVGLDAVEQIVGDIDINLGVDGILQGDNTTVSLDGTALGGALPDIDISVPTSIEALTQDPLGEITETATSLPDTISTLTDSLIPTSDGSGDTDLSINLGVIDEINVPLDVVESITGDIDIDVNAALDALVDPSSLSGTLSDLVTVGGDGALADATAPIVDSVTDTLGGLVGDLAGASDSACWPTAPVADLGDSLVDSVLGSSTGSGGLLGGSHASGGGGLLGGGLFG